LKSLWSELTMLVNRSSIGFSADITGPGKKHRTNRKATAIVVSTDDKFFVVPLLLIVYLLGNLI